MPLALTLLVHLSPIMILCYAATPPKFPAVLIFGDSTVDTGNNNYIVTLFKANHAPYGQDFPNHEATGRFSDGKLVPDFLVSELGIKKLLPPYLDPNLTDDDVRTGVNFASAGSGYDHLTTSMAIPVLQQPEMFKRYLTRLKGNVGEQEASKIISEALILISAGSNDFIFNFYDGPLPTRALQFNISGYQDFILQKLQALVKEIYDVGGRKIVIAGLPPIGCTPIQITPKFKACVDVQNSDALLYNSKLDKLVSQMQASLPGSRMAYADIYVPVMDMIKRPQKYGFEETGKGCCGSGYVEVGPLCNSLTPTCVDPSKFLFWDAIHPTEATYQLVTKYVLENYILKLV